MNLKSKGLESVRNNSDVDYLLIVDYQSELSKYKLTACECDCGINIYFINKSDNGTILNLDIQKGYKVGYIETLYAMDKLSRTSL